MKKIHLTCNQLMVLLDIYRGNYEPSRHVGTVSADLQKLMSNGLVTDLRGLRVLSKGEERVKEMMG